MANYNKTFNFKNGVQVDVDKFIVRGSLVGIGTSIPGEIFDVSGNVRVSGLVTTRDFHSTGIATFTNVKIGAIQISSSSGVITATAFYGNGATLSNLPTSQWVDVDAGLGFTSIYAAGNVGVATTSPFYSLQVGASPAQGLPGIGINSNGNVVSSGIISALSFSGAGFGITALNADNIETGSISIDRIPQLTNAKLPTNISVGIITGTRLNINGPVTATNVQAGIITATTGFVGNLTGTASTALSLTGSINIIVGFVTSVNLDVGILTARDATIYSNLSVGTLGTAFNVRTSTGRVGIGTTTANADLQIRRNGNALLEIISTSSESKISLGQSAQGVGAANSSASIRFGSTPKTLEILNNDLGNINMILNDGDAGFGTGRFGWIYGQTNQELMSLTYDGKLGLGITNPSNTLHVVGTSTVTGNSFFGGNVTVYGTLTAASANLAISNQILQNINLNTTSGITTINQLNLLGQVSANNQNGFFGAVGISTVGFSSDSTKFYVYAGDSIFRESVGIGTTRLILENTILPAGLPAGNLQLIDSALASYNSDIILNEESKLGVGTFLPKSVVDFSRPGLTTALDINFMLLPTVTNAGRNSIVAISGASIYNSTVSAPQYHNGSVWRTLTHTDGNAANAGFATVATQAGISSSVVSASGVVNVQASRVTGISSVGTGITMNSGNTGIVTAIGGFASGIGTAPTQIYVSGNRLVFNVVGIGSTSFVLS